MRLWSLVEGWGLQLTLKQTMVYTEICDLEWFNAELDRSPQRMSKELMSPALW